MPANAHQPDRLPALLYRDGTSQAGRALAALDPASAPVDERTPTDWLRFLRQYARHLTYYDLDNRPAGDWSQLLPFSDEQLEDVARFLSNPDDCVGPRYEAYRRPHVALLVTFLQMLCPVQERMNQFTRRHLDFYFREILGFAPKPRVSGRVHLWIEPASDQPPFLLPAGTLLKGGQDELGQEVHYRTDQGLIVSAARVARCLSLHVKRKSTRLDDLRRDPSRILPILGAKPPWWEVTQLENRTFLALLQMALWDSVPGRFLPAYAWNAGSAEVNEALLLQLDRLLVFIPERLELTLPAFRDLMTLRRRLRVTPPGKPTTEADADWDKVNRILTEAGRKKRDDADYNLELTHRDDFESNLSEALRLDADPKQVYGGLEEVNDIYGLDRRVLLEQPESQYSRFVVNRNTGLAMSLAEFKAMMGIVNGFHEDWRRLLDILRSAGRRKQKKEPDFKVAPVNLRQNNPARWETILEANLGVIPAAAYPHVGTRKLGSLDHVDEELARIERTFHLTAEEFARLRAINAKSGARPWEWEEAFALLTTARHRRDLARRREELVAVGDPNKSVSDRLRAMVLAALAPPETPPQLPGGRSFFALNPDNAQDAEYIRDELLLTPAEVGSVQEASALGESSVPDWDYIAQILDQPRRHRQGWTPARLEFESWRNLYAAADATQVRVGAVGAEETSAPRWRTFGDGPRPDGTTVPGVLGFMIVSPVLALAEGKRTITLTCRCAKEGFEVIRAGLARARPPVSAPFVFRLTTAEGWIEVSEANVSVTANDQQHLAFVLQLDLQIPSIAPLTPEDSPAPARPAMQVLLRDTPDADAPDEVPMKRYELFRELVIESLRLEVEVEGLTALRLQNDDVVLDPKKPFEPFGFAPFAGSRLLVAHPELCTKRLDRLSFDLQWMGLSTDLATHYAGYTTRPAGTAAIKLHDRRVTAVIRKSFDLFTSATLADAAQVLDVTGKDIQDQCPGYAAIELNPAAAEPLAWNRYWEIALNGPDFQHSAYPTDAAKAAATKDGEGRPAPKTINPPYTPRVKALRVSYQSSVELQPGTVGADGADQFHHVEPFGFRPAPLRTEGGWSLLPQCDNEGELYLGIADANPPQNLTLLFQMADGSADPDLAPQTVRWSYLSNNQWKELGGRYLLSDSTRGLLNTGILEFDLPPARPGTLLPSGFYWIRVSVARGSRAVGDLVAVHAQAVRASRAVAEVGVPHAGFVVEPNQITGLVEPRPEVSAVHQPYSSFGGTAPELETHFATRVSERLRHKNRAVTCWDYERLVLEHFPAIYKVKCLPVGSTDDPARASAVQVIVLPDIRGRRPFDPFEPKVSTEILRDIEELLSARTCANAAVQVRNPRYCRLRLRFSVRFQPGCNPAFYLPQLNDEVCRYLSPWAYDDSSEIVFGGRVSANLIVYFVEQRPYVDYVAGMKLFLEPEGGDPTLTDGEELDLSRLEGLTPDLIIVSALQHDIDLIGEDRYEPESFLGVNYMKIELDFRVA